MQIHYGAGEDALLDCFIYEGLDREAARARFFISHGRKSSDGGITMLVDHADTPCFALGKMSEGDAILPDSFVTLVAREAGRVTIGETALELCRGSKLFVPYGCGEIVSEGAELLVCYPPKI